MHAYTLRPYTAPLTVLPVSYFIYVARKYERSSLEQLPTSIPDPGPEAERDQELEIIPV